MKNSYKIIFVGYVLLALKIINKLVFQIGGLLGYLLIAFGLLRLRESKETKIASGASFGLFLLTGYEFIKAPVNAISTFSFILAVVQVILYVLLNWILLYFMFDDITKKFKDNKMVNDANLCQKKKNKFMNLLLYSVICQNCAFMFPRLGAILFMIGIALSIYLSIAQILYMKRISTVL